MAYAEMSNVYSNLNEVGRAAENIREAYDTEVAEAILWVSARVLVPSPTSFFLS
jgi:hypothetical protein